MKYLVALLLALPIVISIALFSSPSHAISSCNGLCHTLDDCTGQLICVNGRCHDDPDVGTHTCPSTPSPSGGGCQPAGTMNCHGKSFPRYHCSPPVTSSTPATLTNNDFSEGGDGGGPSECDDSYHKNSELIVALSTGWYADGSRCANRIRITSTKTRRSVIAKVVDECDSMNGCDGEHAGQPPCKNNIVDGSNAVWHALGLDIEVGEEDVTWSMV
ncbi:hypothetical protein EUGRSUZ_B02524 [Eucalyptus grandis]|uniref:Uncharacterized protein n=2 Tax=Eucalyptus grandis TaxID=71139 RepID=A0ACC3LUF8_EUCGR|nr:hypothetical protein EUGRSUZ_B02524 [Eucalyptus grandis]